MCYFSIYANINVDVYFTYLDFQMLMLEYGFKAKNREKDVQVYVAVLFKVFADLYKGNISNIHVSYIQIQKIFKGLFCEMNDICRMET